MSLHGAQRYARSRVPDGSARDSLLFMDIGFRMGKHKDGIGSMPPRPTLPHPMMQSEMQKSCISRDPNWTDTNGWKPAAASEWDSTDSPAVYHMRDGITVLFRPKKGQGTTASSDAKAQLGDKANVAAVSMPGSKNGLGPKSTPRSSRASWRSRETFSTFESWARQGEVPSAASGSYSARGKQRLSQCAEIDAAAAP